MDEVKQGSGRDVGAVNGIRTLGKCQVPGSGGVKLGPGAARWPARLERLRECRHSLGP